MRGEAASRGVVDQRSLRETQRKMVESAQLAEFMTVLAGTGDLEELVHRAAEKISEIFQAELVFILVQDPVSEKLEVKASIGLLGRAARADELEDYFVEAWETGMATQWVSRGLTMARMPVKSAICIRASGQEEPVGVIGLGRRYPMPFDDQSLSLLTMMSQSLGMAIDNTLLHEGTQRRALQLEQLAFLSANIASSLDLKGVMDQACLTAVYLLDVDAAAIGLIDDDGYITLRSSYGLEEEVIDSVRVHYTESITGIAFEHRRPCSAEDIQSDSRVTYQVTRDKGVRGMLVIPLISMGEKVGVLYFISFEPRRFTKEETELAEVLASPVTSSIRNARAFEHVQEQAIRDGLTGLYNHSFFKEQLIIEMKRIRRDGQMLSLLMLDLDDFKTYNDTFGHLAGDKLLKEVARCIRENVRDSDTSYRYGGEEFAVILPKTDCVGAQLVAEKIRLGIKDLSSGEGTRISVSIGVSALEDEDLHDLPLIDRADIALYYAKFMGKDRSEKFCKIPLEYIKLRELLTKFRHLAPGGESAVEEVSRAISAGIGTRSGHYEGHRAAVAKYACLIGERMSLNSAALRVLNAGGELHDIGMAVIPDSILLKPGPFTPEERELIESHTLLGAKLLSDVPGMEDVLPLLLYHHERVDGTGYPERLAGERIPLEARILHVADAFDAMISPRPWRPALSREEAVQELLQNAGTDYDVKVVEVFMGLLSEGLNPGL